ncbi:tripartite motif-containing protein 35 [Thalassophryne amazonica]|uniref:tripartite motif-containing protein 35 n=1 Tax=Thalassophryne amazonica TaxID=390379 RepID=UPI0014720D0E|nr:tripartite motif-containing protein 35 [Thalassophryne amazonica]
MDSQADHEEEQLGPQLPDDQRSVCEHGEEDAVCPGCEAVGVRTLPCGHKLCPACIQLSQEELGQAGCTICYGSQLMDSVLHTLLDTLFTGQPRRPRTAAGAEGDDATGTGNRADGPEEEEDLCLQHGEALSLFCLDEEELICQQCASQEHEDHQHCVLREAIVDCKTELRSHVRRLHEQLERLSSIRQTWKDISAHIKDQSVQTSRTVREEFEKMHQFLHDEEAALMSQVKQEEEEKDQRMNEKISRISDDIKLLTDIIRETEDSLGCRDLLLLKNYKKTSARVRRRIKEPGDEYEALVDVAKHHGCLQHRVWDKMQSIIQYFPVTLDPNTASACLGMSRDLSRVYICEEQTLPDNPERFVSPPSILGSEGYTSGRHSWEVEVGENSQWALGVASEMVHRKPWSDTNLDPSVTLNTNTEPSSGLWIVSLSSGEYRASPGHNSPLKLRRRPRRVRIQLDWERGSLTFFDTNDNSLIYRFKNQWSGTLKPYLSTTCSQHPLKIAAGKVTVSLE